MTGKTKALRLEQENNSPSPDTIPVKDKVEASIILNGLVNKNKDLILSLFYISPLVLPFSINSCDVLSRIFFFLCKTVFISFFYIRGIERRPQRMAKILEGIEIPSCHSLLKYCHNFRTLGS